MKIQEYCKQRGKKIELAQKTALSGGFISLLCSGKKMASPETAKKIEEATGGLVTRMELLYPEE